MTPAAALTAVASLIPWPVYQNAMSDFKETKAQVVERVVSETKDDNLAQKIRNMFLQNTTIESDLILQKDKIDSELAQKLSEKVFGVDISGLKQKLQEEVTSWVKKRHLLEKIDVKITLYSLEKLIDGAMFKLIGHLDEKFGAEGDLFRRYKIARKKLTVVSRAVAWLISMLKVNARPSDTNGKTVKKLQTSHWIAVSKYMQQIEFNRKLQQKSKYENGLLQ